MHANMVFQRVLSTLLVFLVADLVIVSARIVRKICKDAEIEILSSQGVKIEPYNTSRVELSLADPSRLLEPLDTFQMSFDFKTSQTEGVLFYGHTKIAGERIALTMDDGYLHYHIQCPTLHAVIYIPTRDRQPVNDGRWHNISLHIDGPHLSRSRYVQGKKSYVRVDGFSKHKIYEVSCQSMSLLVMGGISPSHSDLHSDLRNGKHYEGCIRNLRVKTALTMPPMYTAVSVCE